MYYLSFFNPSFAAIEGGVKYYLFNNRQQGTEPLYAHLFFCRHFDVYNNTGLVNGKSFVVNGDHLLYRNNMRAKEAGGNAVPATFHTRSLTFLLRIINTNNVFCGINPQVVVHFKNIEQNKVTLSNLNLENCNEGDLMADVILTRGIKGSRGDFTHLFDQRINNLMIGKIGCDASCKSCSGPTSSECTICFSSSDFLYSGTCYTACPSIAPYYDSYERVL